MLSSSVFILISFLFGFSATLFLKEEFLLEERIFYGVLIGFVACTWIGYIEALFFGLDLNTIIFTSAVLLIFTFIILFINYRLVSKQTVPPLKNFLKSEVIFQILILSCILFPVLYVLFGRVIIWKEDGIYTGLIYNFGDLPYHWSMLNSFLYGENLPPEIPFYSGYPLRYYFMSNFFTALLMKSGLSLWAAFTFQGMVLSTVLLATIYLFTYHVTKNKFAAALSPFLFFFNGGLGSIHFFKDLIAYKGNIIDFLLNIKDYSNIGDLGYRWINTTTSLLVTQRPFLFGFPMSIMVLTLLWQGIKEPKKSYFLMAGVIAGILPLFHTPSYLSLGIISAVLLLLFPSRRWLWFFIPAGFLALPQAYYLMPKGETAGHFFSIHLGWMANDDNVFLFYLKNAGLFIPILLGTLIFSRSLSFSQKKFAIPFIVIFLIANLIQFTPWDWDNVKILIYFYIGSIPFVAYGLARLWKSTYKIIPILLGLTLVFSGITSVVSTTMHSYSENNKEEINLAETIKKITGPDDVFLTAPIHNHLVFLTGRTALHGYAGHLWSWGIDGSKRMEDIRKMYEGYKGYQGTKKLLDKYGVNYVVIGPPEKREMKPNLEFYKNNFPILVKSENYYVFKIKDGS